ncbi:hypothetical protein ABLE91_07520 [Aquabacter sp. CN5-332]|uniref:hypothetical protein n=1 Tax=Aquabacter sp. CN5-332 TaxID=3156608 RepID=UPI0032B3CB33
MRTGWGMRGTAMSVAAALVATTVSAGMANAGPPRRALGVIAGAALGAVILGGIAAASAAQQPAPPPKRQASSKPKAASGVTAMAQALPAATEIAALDMSADPFGGAPSGGASEAVTVNAR